MANYTRTISASFLSSGLAGTIGYAARSSAGATLIARTTDGISEAGSSGVYTANAADWDPAWGGVILWDDGAGNFAAETFLPYDPAGGGTDTGPTLQAIVEGVCTRAARPTDPRNSIGGAIDSAPTEAEFDAKLRAEAAAAIAATAASLPPTPPAAYATASALAAVKADTGKLSGLIETTTVDGIPVDRFKAPALAQAPTGPGRADPAAIVAAINQAGVRLRADGLDSVIMEPAADTPINFRRGMSVVLAALAGAVAGADGEEVSISGAGTSALRIRAVTDESGNREVTLYLPN